MVMSLFLIYLKEPSALSSDTYYALAVAMLGVPAAIMSNLQRSILEGAGRFSASATMRIGLGAAASIIPLLISLFVQKAIWMLAALVVLRVAMLVQQHRTLVVLGLLDVPLKSWLSITKRNEKLSFIFLRESWWYASIAPTIIIMSGFDKFIILALSNFSLADLAIFVAPQEFALKAIVLPASVIPALFVRIAASEDRYHETKKNALWLFYFLSCLILLSCSVIIFNSHLLADWLFPTYPQSDIARFIVILTFGVFANSVAQFPMAVLTARGLISRAAMLQIGQLPLVILALTLLLPRIGIIAAAIVWSGRIVLDAMFLLMLADRSAPNFTVRGWKLSYLAGVAALAAISFLT
jgi:O-antigen/teichoic acid export membrane protein